ncbi:MAG: hypothetical protein PVJ75_02405 [Chloroflexota bacterium]|jgi:hypothetical protein
MNKRSATYLQGIPMKPYDMIREGLIVLVVVVLLAILLAAIFSSPDYPTVRAEDVAKIQPIAYLRTTANILAGNSEIQTYGPPYTDNSENAQAIFGLAPATWFGVSMPLNPREDFVLKPLGKIAILNKDLDAALQTYQAATAEQQQAWLKAYIDSLDTATVENDVVTITGGDYGPIPTLMRNMLDLGRAGLLEGALDDNAQLPYTLDFTRSLLYFQGDVDHSVAESLNMLGEQWGISHETGSYPGAWWLWPYTGLYQIPPMSTSDNGDLQVVAIVMVMFLILLFMPFIPILNRLPRWLGLYRIIWRDWYHRGPDRSSSDPAPESS